MWAWASGDSSPPSLFHSAPTRIQPEGFLGAPAQRLKSGHESELIEGVGPHLHDQVPQGRDLVRDQAPRLVDGLVRGRGPAGADGGGQNHLNSDQFLKGLVVQLAGPAPTFSFLAVAAGPSPLPREITTASHRTAAQHGGAADQQERHDVQAVEKRLLGHAYQL
jgi:hypothetical protein